MEIDSTTPIESSQSSQSAQSGQPSTGVGRKILTVALLIVFGLTSVLSVVSIWSARQINDTDAYLRTVSPLADDPVIQADLADRISTRITTKLQEVIPDDVLADRDGTLIAPLRLLIEQYVDQIVLEFVQSDRFEQLWDESQRLVHEAVEVVLTGVDSDLVSETNGQIVLDIAPLIDDVLKRLQDRGIEAVSRINVADMDTSYVLFESEQLGEVRDYVQLLETLRYVFPIIALIAAGLYLYLTRNRWRGTTWVAATLMIAMATFLLLLATGRWQYLLRVNTENMTEATAAAYYDTITNTLRTVARWIVLFGLIVLVVIQLFKPGGWLTRSSEPDSDAAPGSSVLGQSLSWIGGHRIPVAGALIGACCLIIIALDQVTSGWAVAIFLLASAALGVLITNRGTEPELPPGTGITPA